MEQRTHNSERYFLAKINKNTIEGVSLSEYVNDLNDLYYWFMEYHEHTIRFETLYDLHQEGKITDTEYIKAVKKIDATPLTEKYIKEVFYSLKECCKVLQEVAHYKQEIENLNVLKKCSA